MNSQTTLLSLFVSLLIASCSMSDSNYKLLGVYRIDLQQGNVIEQDMLDRLKPGMDKNQVQFIMGTPAINDPFRTNRWDYIYTFTKGANARQQRHLALYFEDNKLTYIDGNIVAGFRKPPEDLKKKSQTVEVPLRTYKEKGIFGRVVDNIPFVGDLEARPPSAEKQSEINLEDGIEDTTEETVEGISSNEELSDTTEPTESKTDKEESKGFFGRMLDKLPFGSDSDEKE